MKDEKIFGIRRGYIEVIAALVVMIFFLGFIIGSVSAITNTTSNITSNATVNVTPTVAVNATPTKTPIPTPTEIRASFVPVQNVTLMPTPTPTQIPTIDPFGNITVRRIDQGGCVVPGETIDIAGIGWYTGYIAYFDQYRTMKTEGLNATKIYEIKPWELRHYYVDPTLFKDYPGWWYSHYETVESGNSQLFKINATCNVTPPTRPEVVENKTILITGGIKLPPKYIEGISFILSRNATTKLGADNRTHWWLFGNYDMKQYDVPVDPNNLITFSRMFTNSISTGQYTLVFVDPGANNITEETYDRDLNAVSSPFRDVAETSLNSTSQEVQLAALAKMVNKSIDDKYTMMRIEVQDPMVEVRQLDTGTTVDGMNTATIAGYTNVNPGSIVTIEFDKGTIDPKLARANTWNTTVDSPYAPNAYRTWFKTVLFNPNDFRIGTHTLTVTTESGAYANPPITIRRELEGSYQPPSTFQFIDNNPFIPTPTPEPAPPPVVVTVVQTVVQEKIVTQEKIVPIDPYPYVIGGIIAVIVVAYVIYSIARAIVNERRKRKFDINKGEL
jgi:hypothetical protein